MTSHRDFSIDMARGLAMIFVVMGHALVGILSAGSDTQIIRFLLITIYSFHMALFFIVSGMLSGGMARRAWPDVLRLLTLRVVWPYVLWGILLLLAGYLMRGQTNTPVEVFRPWVIIWKPPSVMWFLYYLFFGILLMRLLAPLPKLTALIVGLILLAVGYLQENGPITYVRWIGLFLIAASVGGNAAVWAARRTVLILGAGIMALMFWLAWQEAADPLLVYPASQPIFLPAYFAGSAVVLGLAKLWAQSGHGLVAQALSYIGQHTMPIFVTHILITAGTRIALRLTGAEDPVLVVGLGTILGVSLPLAAAALAERLGLSAVLGWR
ncbi:acyltransferase family protein [Sagittula sp. SSi028]|uniref:acyltransferase family protein n=1 Tax=Sagittula sp. SSi028 TaxID=3400636 RepID=UPI003AF7291A